MLIVPLAMLEQQAGTPFPLQRPAGVVKFRKMQSNCFSLVHPLRHGLVVVKAKLPNEL